jgi:hypothetical protein
MKRRILYLALIAAGAFAQAPSGLTGGPGSGGGGGVSNVATGCGLSGGPITGTGTLVSAETVNAQTGTTYTILTGDCGKLVTFSNGSAVAVTLPQASASFPSGWWMDVQNRGAGTVTITPTTSTIDGAASIALTQNQGVRIVSDGTNYFTMRGIGGSTPASAAELSACRITGQGTATATFGGPCNVVRNNYKVPAIATATMEITANTGNQTAELFLTSTDGLVLVTTTAVTVTCTGCSWTTNPTPAVLDDATPLATMTNTAGVWSAISVAKADIYLGTIAADAGGGLTITTSAGIRSLSLNSTVPRTTGAWPLLGDYDMSAGRWAPPTAAVAGLPAAASYSGYVYRVTDGSSGTDCTVGGGSTEVWCRSNGSAWAAIGGGSASNLSLASGKGHVWAFGPPDGSTATAQTGSTTVYFRETYFETAFSYSAAHAVINSAGTNNTDAAWALYDTATCTKVTNSQVTLEELDSPTSGRKFNAAGTAVVAAGTYYVGFAAESNVTFANSTPTAVHATLNADSSNPRVFTAAGVVATGGGATDNWLLPASCSGAKTGGAYNVPNIIFVVQ